MSRQRIAAQTTQEASSAAKEDIDYTLNEICRELDIPRPIWLDKNDREMESFGKTSFLPEHFMEEVFFDKFEFEILREKGRSRDPRNDFSDAGF